MTFWGRLRSGWKEPDCSFVLPLKKLLGGRGDDSYNGSLLIFPSWYRTQLLVFFLVGSPEVAPDNAAAAS